VLSFLSFHSSGNNGHKKHTTIGITTKKQQQREIKIDIAIEAIREGAGENIFILLKNAHKPINAADIIVTIAKTPILFDLNLHFLCLILCLIDFVISSSSYANTARSAR